MFNFPFYKIFPTRTWKQFEKHADNIFKLGRSFVDNVGSSTSRQDNFNTKCQTSEFNSNHSYQS